MPPSVRRAPVVCLAVLAATLVTARADCDLQSPALTSFTFTPSSVNTSLASQNVTCTMVLTDALSGIETAGCQFISPDFLQVESCSATAPSAGTPNNGTYSCTVTLPRYSRSGAWMVNAVTADDVVGNQLTVDMVTLIMRGFPTSLIVTSDPDITPPQLGAFDFNPKSVNVTSAPATVTCSMPVTDNKSGVDAAVCYFSSPSGKQAAACVASAPSSGTRTAGTFSCGATVPRYAEQGTWVVSMVQLIDMINNYSFYQTSDLASMGRPTNLVVTSSPDVTPPSLTNFTFSPNPIDTSTGNQSVTCNMSFTDSPAGVAYASCFFALPSGYSFGCTTVTPFSGTPQNGTYRCSVTFPHYAPGGNYEADVTTADAVGNSMDYDRTELEARGFAAVLNNLCSGGSSGSEVTLNFTNPSTLTWTAMTGALRYNVYRGSTSGLVDFDFDGLPDGGYGVCQNASDPNPTDTVFVDASLPPQGGPGYHYLVSYTDAGGEQGLGTTSDGLDRTVFFPCP
ncbi:MAG: hypothetical protein KBD01_17680 [Acidobacteria bacterium]|nr:hypothetical protein [Acidobacteriota bacterium]